LSQIETVRVHDFGRVLGGIVTFSAEHTPAQNLQRWLIERRANTSVSVASTTRLDALSRQLPSMVRASVHYYNTEAEVARFCTLVGEAVSDANRFAHTSADKPDGA
jgi:selenocysteine lyase/cysteine desulfurase